MHYKLEETLQFLYSILFVGYPVGLFIDSSKGTATDTNITNGNL